MLAVTVSEYCCVTWVRHNRNIIVKKKILKIDKSEIIAINSLSYVMKKKWSQNCGQKKILV